ncbi:MAG: hypothetical protein KatS3mg021_1238 [Fimbriimonadales bacterium]|nr:MAG: hypothetical protein KatS3mg021_1238 [Fimbriimonadales bacterium]
MASDRVGAATAERVESLAVRIRGVHVVPVRHHSPALARAVAEVIRAVRPQRVLIEGPCDANEWIPALAHPEAEAPLALLAYRQPDTRGQTASANLTPQFCFYPMCDYSPELVALRTAAELGIPTAFCDIPARAALREPDADPEESAPATSDTPSVWTRVAQRMGFRNHEEWWESVFESHAMPTPILLRMLHEWGKLVIAESPPSERDQLRNAHMWRWVENTIAEGVPPEAIVLVVGAAHSAAFDQPDFKADYDPNHPLLNAPPAQFVLIPYSFPRLSEQSGYGAGNRAPQFYQDLWQFGSLEMATCVALTRMVNQMKLQGDSASHADAIEAFRVAKALAALRGKRQPGFDEVIDAGVAAFGRGSEERVRHALQRVLIGERVGRVPPDCGVPPLNQEFHLLAKQLGIPVKDNPTDLRLNLAEPHAVQQSIFLHRVNVAGIPFAEFRRGETATLQQIGRLREHWRVQWTPLTDPALAEAVIYGNTLREVARNRIRPRLEERENLETVSKAALEAVLCDLPELYGTALEALEEASVRDGDFLHLSAATYRLAALVEYGGARAAQREVFQPLMERMYARACLHLPASTDCGDETAYEIGKAIRLMHDLAARVPALDQTLWLAQLHETTLLERTHPYLKGLGVGLLGWEQDAESPLFALAQRMLSPGNDIVHTAQFIEGLLNANPGVVARSRQMVARLDSFVQAIPKDHFLRALPALRRAFSNLSRNDIHYLTESLTALYGLDETGDPNRPKWVYTELTPTEVEALYRQLEWLCAR